MFCADEAEIVAEARRRFELHFEEPSALPSDIKTYVYRLVLKAGGKAEYARILQTYYDTDDNAVRKYALYSLGAAKDATLKVNLRKHLCQPGHTPTTHYTNTY